MKAQDLKNSILQLAMQGKLVPQDPNDEPAAFYLENLKGFGKKSHIYIKDNHFYEKIGKKEPVCIDEEIPFEIPNNWTLCRLEDICKLNGGFAFKSSEFKDKGIRIIRISDFDENGFKNNKIVYYDENNDLNKYVLENNDIIMAMTGGTVGKTLLVKDLSEKMYVNQRVADIKIINGIDVDFIYFILQSPLIKGIIHKNKNSTNDNISMKTIKSFIIPIPPLNEQKSIVAKIVEFLPLIDEYSANKQQLDKINSELPSKLKSSILQEAFQGKLVPQDPNDEPASILLDNIKKVKEQLIKAKKIKQNNKESVIYKENGSYYEKIGKKESVCIDEELPFEIPDNWEWCCMNQYLDVRDGTHDTPQYVEKGIPLVTSKDFKNGSIDLSKTKYISIEDHEKISQRSFVDDGDILFSMIGGNIGNAIIVSKTFEFSIKNVALFKTYNSPINKEYIFYYLNFIKNEIQNNAAGGAQPFISLTALRNYYLPLPPLNEQKRIVDKIEQLFENVDVLINE